MFAAYAEGHERAGQTIERQATCACGRTFTQMLLSPRELAAAERLGVIDRIRTQIPGFYVPVHCPPCERQDLGRQARIEQARDIPSSRRTTPRWVAA